jgi:hypothetical protein
MKDSETGGIKPICFFLIPNANISLATKQIRRMISTACFAFARSIAWNAAARPISRRAGSRIAAGVFFRMKGAITQKLWND